MGDDKLLEAVEKVKNYTFDKSKYPILESPETRRPVSNPKNKELFKAALDDRRLQADPGTATFNHWANFHRVAIVLALRNMVEK